MILLGITFISGVLMVAGMYPEPLPAFKEKSTKLSPTDDMFLTLLNSQRLENSRMEDTKNEIQLKQNEENNYMKFNPNYRYNTKFMNVDHMNSNDAITYHDMHDDIIYETTQSSVQEADEPNEGSPWYVSAFRNIVETGQYLNSGFQHVLDTVHKVVRIYQDERKKLNMTISHKSPDKEASVTKTITNIVQDAASVNKLKATRRSASDKEDEILTALSSMLIGADARSGHRGGGYGSALTLDPVTIIALLTLAAYLIRAVYQILANQSTGRQLSGLPHYLRLPDIARTMTTLYNYIEPPDYSNTRYARSIDDNRKGKGLLALPGSVATFAKLVSEGHQDCARQYVCDQISRRSLFSYNIEDLFLVGLGYYFAETDIWNLLSRRSSGTDAWCAAQRETCSPKTLSEARKLNDLFTEASSQFLSLWRSTVEARERSKVSQEKTFEEFEIGEDVPDTENDVTLKNN